MKFITYFLLFAALIVSQHLIAQTSLLQDYEGKSSLNLSQSDSIKLSINMADAGLTLILSDNDVPTNKQHFFAGQLKFSGKDGKLPVIKGGVANFQIEGGVTYTWMPQKDNTRYYFYASYKLAVSRVKVVTEGSGTITTDTHSPVNHKIQIGYNDLAVKNTNFIIGLALQAGVSDNTSEIDSYDYRDVQTNGTNASGGIVQIASDQISTVYLSTDYYNNVNFVKPMADIGYSLPKMRLLPMVHLRWNTFPNHEAKSTYSPGFGLYYTAAKAPTNVVLGLQLFYKDWYDSNNKGDSKWERAVTNVVAGFKF